VSLIWEDIVDRTPSTTGRPGQVPFDNVPRVLAAVNAVTHKQGRGLLFGPKFMQAPGEHGTDMVMSHSWRAGL